MMDDGDMSSDVDSDGDVSETRRREALEHMARIEKEFAELKDRLYQEKMFGLNKEIELVTSGTHHDFVDHMNNLEKKQAEKLRVAKLWRDYQLECIENIYKAEREHAENDHLNEQQSLREQMLSTLQEKVKRLEEEKNSMEITTVRSDANHDAVSRGGPNTRKQRRKHLEQDNKNPKKRILAGPQMITALKEHEVMEDLLNIRKNMPQQTRRAAQKNLGNHGA